MESWEELNHQVKAELQLPSDLSVRVFPNLYQAVFEVVLGTGLFYSHKKSLAWLKGQTFAFENVMPFLYKESFQVQSFSLLNFRQQYPDTANWVSGLAKDTNFVIRNDDHPVTSELFDLSDVDQLLSEKKIFSFVVSHDSHKYYELKMYPYKALLCEYGPDLCIGIFGSKFKTPVQTSKFFYFDSKKVIQEIKKVKELKFNLNSNSSVISTFEEKLAEPFVPFFEKNKTRTFAYSLFYNEQLNAEALQRNLEKNLNLTVGQGIQSFNLCNNPYLDLTWWEGKPRDSVRRGLLSISTEVAGLKDIHAKIQEAASECQI